MDVSVDSLFTRIGRSVVEADVLREQVASAKQALAVADAEVTRLRAEVARLSAKPATEPPATTEPQG